MPRAPAERKPCAICGGTIPLTRPAQARVCGEACAKERKRRVDAARVEYYAEYERRRTVARHAQYVPLKCEVCGKEITKIRPGNRSKTCGEECAKERRRQIEGARYHEKIKGSPEFLAQRAQYLESLRQRMEADPDFAQRVQAAGRRNNANYEQRKALSGLMQTGQELHKRSIMKNGMRKVHPGEILREDFMVAEGMTPQQFADKTNLPLTMIAPVLEEVEPVTHAIAAAIVAAWGGDIQSWINLQTAYDEHSCNN